MRFQPKQWAPPRSRNARDGDDGDTLLLSTEVLKDLWNAEGWERPAWAKTARKFGWLTTLGYYAVPLENTGKPTFIERVYSQSPFFGLLRKDKDFS